MGVLPLRLPLAALLAGGLFACPAAEEQGLVLTFTATPNRIGPGDSVQLAWTSSNAAACLLTPGIGEVPANGATLVNPTATTTYELFCNGSRSTVLVTVAPRASIGSFVASPSEVAPDTVVELIWMSTGADRCTLEPGFGEVDLNGSRIVTPTQTTTYTLTCTGGGATASKTATVTVVPVTSLTMPSNVQVTPQDGALRVTWTQGAGSANVYLAEVAGITSTNVTTLAGGVVFRRVASPFTVTGLVNGRTYFLRVSAVSGSIESALSAEVSGVPMGVAGSDPLFGEQWHLSNPNGEDLRVTGAWNAGIKGEGVKVVVVDEGVDLNHEDLRANIATGLSWDYLGSAPLRLAEHGTAVAGLIGARDLNNVGVRGAAPRASLFSYNLLQDLTSANEYDAMTRQKSLVMVSNNSWGDAYDSTGFVTEADPQWLRGVAEGTSLGRGGKGLCYFWASGNGGDPTEPYRDDSNFDGQANSRYVFTISGVGRDGKLASYAESGANVLVAAPTEGDDGVALTTTDITGTLGYNDGATPGEHSNVNYTSAMSGTSASTPLAAAVGALVLQARPELSWRDVRRVLALSARKNDPTSPGWSTNGANLPIHHGYGFGVVDANAAVALAKTITPVGPQVVYATPSQQPGLAIPDDGLAVTSTLNVSGSGISRIEFIEVQVTLPHARSGDLLITLSKQGGASDVLHPIHTCAPDQGQEWCQDLTPITFGTVRHLDEGADGAWTLSVRDGRGSVTGSFDAWSLRIYGRQ